VLKGDVYGFGVLMHARADGPVRQALEDAVTRWARGAAVAQTGAGDSLLIAHQEPVALAQIARHIMDDVYQATGQPRLRMALHYGEVEVQPSLGDEPATVVGGEAILYATRVEPHVVPGQIWATEEFRRELAQRPSLWRTTQILAPDGTDRINVKKDGRSEPDLWVSLYRLEF
jgi:class 3 adenylate cyclase